MCKYFGIEFACHHTRRTETIWKCDKPSSCGSDERVWIGASQMPDVDDLPSNLFHYLSLEGVLCPECGIDVMRERAVQENELKYINDQLAQFHVDVEQLERAQQGLRGAAIKKDKREVVKAVIQPGESQPAFTDDTQQSVSPSICSSGDCQGRVVVSRKGAQGEFCSKHTCAARLWDCLHDNFGQGRGGPSKYCLRHTCTKAGCCKMITNAPLCWDHWKKEKAGK